MQQSTASWDFDAVLLAVTLDYELRHFDVHRGKRPSKNFRSGPVWERCYSGPCSAAQAKGRIADEMDCRDVVIVGVLVIADAFICPVTFGIAESVSDCVAGIKTGENC